MANPRKMKWLTAEGDEVLTAELHCSHWKAEANQAAERGQTAKAEALYDKSQYWLDRYNELAGNG
jgi:hypothetical protein